MSSVPVAPSSGPPRHYRWSREQLYRAIDAGVFDENRNVELVDGELTTEGMVDTTRQGALHATGLSLADSAIRQAFGSTVLLRAQVPLSIGDASDVAPDVAVVPGNIGDYRDRHPSTALQIIEVADATVRYDRTVKASLHASAGIQEYWIVNLRARVLEVHREPVPDADEQFGFCYARIQRLSTGESISPLAAPEAEIRVEGLLP